MTYDVIFALQGGGVTSSYSALGANSTLELRKVLTGCDDDDAAVGDDEEDEPVVAVGRGSATDRVLFHVVLASVRTTSFLTLHGSLSDPYRCMKSGKLLRCHGADQLGQWGRLSGCICA